MMWVMLCAFWFEDKQGNALGKERKEEYWRENLEVCSCSNLWSISGEQVFEDASIPIAATGQLSVVSAQYPICEVPRMLSWDLGSPQWACVAHPVSGSQQLLSQARAAWNVQLYLFLFVILSIQSPIEINSNSRTLQHLLKPLLFWESSSRNCLHVSLPALPDPGNRTSLDRLDNLRYIWNNVLWK